jgi:hypothetical protein
MLPSMEIVTLVLLVISLLMMVVEIVCERDWPRWSWKYVAGFLLAFVLAVTH